MDFVRLHAMQSVHEICGISPYFCFFKERKMLPRNVFNNEYFSIQLGGGDCSCINFFPVFS